MKLAKSRQFGLMGNENFLIDAPKALAENLITCFQNKHVNHVFHSSTHVNNVVIKDNFCKIVFLKKCTYDTNAQRKISMNVKGNKNT